MNKIIYHSPLFYIEKFLNFFSISFFISAIFMIWSKVFLNFYDANNVSLSFDVVPNLPIIFS